MNRRKIRKYRNQRRNSGVKFAGFIGIMIIAIVCGYLTARFVIAPLLGYDTEVLKLDFPSNLTEVFQRENQTAEKNTVDVDVKKEDKADKYSPSDDGGYALQFGVFTTKGRAEELVTKLERDGIETEIKETDDTYKVLSPVVSTKDAAVEKLKRVKTDQVSDVFITVIN